MWCLSEKLNRLDKLVDLILMMFSNGKCKVLRVERNNPMHQYRLEPGQLDISFTEKDPGDPCGPPVAHEPAMNPQGKEGQQHPGLH